MSRRRPRSTHESDGRIGYCEFHDKMTYSSRKAARKAARTILPHEQLSAYPCTLMDGHWHFGHLHPAIVAGRLTRDGLPQQTLTGGSW